MFLNTLINKDKPAEEYKLAVPAIGRNNGAALYRQIQTVYKQKQGP